MKRETLALIDSSSKSLVIRITDPAYAPNKGAVTFCLSFAEPGGPDVMKVPGWRVWKGEVIPPSTRKKNGTYFTTVKPDPEFMSILNCMVQEWAKDFPLVRFPSIAAPEEEE